MIVTCSQASPNLVARISSAPSPTPPLRALRRWSPVHRTAAYTPTAVSTGRAVSDGQRATGQIAHRGDHDIDTGRGRQCHDALAIGEPDHRDREAGPRDGRRLGGSGHSRGTGFRGGLGNPAWTRPIGRPPAGSPPRAPRLPRTCGIDRRAHPAVQRQHRRSTPAKCKQHVNGKWTSVLPETVFQVPSSFTSASTTATRSPPVASAT